MDYVVQDRRAEQPVEFYSKQVGEVKNHGISEGYAERASFDSNLRIYETYQKAMATEIVRTEEYRKRLKLKEEKIERQRVFVEELVVDSDGRVCIISRNTAVFAQPRLFTNMVNPSLTIFKCVADYNEQVYCISCFVGAMKTQVFLEPNKIMRGEYLPSKFACAGIYFITCTQSKRKQMLLQLIAVMKSRYCDEKIVPVEAGWYEDENGSTKFADVEDITWKVLKKLAM